MADSSAGGRRSHHRPTHHRPALPGVGHFEALANGPGGGLGPAGATGSADPAARSEAADRCATLLVRGARNAEDEGVVARIVALADTEGLDTLADLFEGAPSESLAGCLWRLYLLRAGVYADAVRASREFDQGRRAAPVAEAVAGVVDPPDPDGVRALVDAVLRGAVQGDFADTLFRAGAFARVLATGRARENDLAPGDGDRAHDLSAARLVTLADQLEHAARLEAAGRLA